MITYALLVTALLFGGMTLYSFAFAAFLFTALPADTASPLNPSQSLSLFR